MATIGMLGKSTKPTKLKLAMACVAKVKEVHFFYFTPDDIIYKDKKIKGRFYNGDEWEEGIFPYPDYIYDRLLFRGKGKYKNLYKELSHIIFNNEKQVGGSMNKIEMYELISKSDRFNEYLIPYSEAINIEDILTQLEKYKRIVCKASEGSLGLNVYYIQKNDKNDYNVKIFKDEYKYTLDELKFFLHEKFISVSEKFVIQPFISSKTNSGNPFDLRAHLMKDKNGRWKIVRIYPRIGAQQSIISNLHLGGSTCALDTFLTKHITLKNVNDFRRKLRSFSLDCAKYIESEQDYHFSEIGLDIAIDENEKIWLFEVNLNRINVQNLTFEAAVHAISYGKYAINNIK